MDHGELQERVGKLLERLPLLRQWQELNCGNGKNPRAFVIEFAGMPKAGKSSAIEDLRHFFSHAHRDKRAPQPSNPQQNFKYVVHTPAEGVSLRTPGELRDDKEDFNTWAGSYALQELLQACHDVRNDIVVLDRGPWDAGCWLQYWRKMSASTITAVADFFQLDNWTTLSDLHVVLLVNPNDARERERRFRLIEHDGTASNTELMLAMKEIYEERFNHLQKVKAEICPHVGKLGALRLNTSESMLLDTQTVAVIILERVFDVLAAKVQKHSEDFTFTVGFFERHILGYFPKVSAEERKNALAFLPNLVVRANALPSDKRIQFKRGVEERSAPPQPLIGLRSLTEKDNQLQHSLEELLSKVEQQ